MDIFKKTPFRTVIMALCISLACGFLTANLTALAESAAAPRGLSGNVPPIAETLEFSTFRDVPLTERLSSTDPDGDAVTFEITAPPRKGDIAVASDGAFVYTPKAGFRGRDSFSYVAVDTAGNVSSEAAVRINVKKRLTKTVYADMNGHSAAYAALSLCENGIFTGEMLGNEYFFRPDQPVTRGEFLAMCLNAGGSDTLTGVTRTGFYDDESIPMWVKPYVSTALMSGIIGGSRTLDGRIVFNSDVPITFSEAAVMLNNTLGITDVVSVAVIETDPDTPVWAYTAVANLNACRIIPDEVSDIYSRQVTRADAAEMLLASNNLFEAQAGGKSLLGWANG